MNIIGNLRLYQESRLRKGLGFLRQITERKPPCLRRSACPPQGFWRRGFAQAGLKFLQPAPLRPNLSRINVFRHCPTGWVPEEASSAQPFGYGCIGSKDKGVSTSCEVSTLLALNAGLMKPLRGSARLWVKGKNEGAHVDRIFETVIGWWR